MLANSTLCIIKPALASVTATRCSDPNTQPRPLPPPAARRQDANAGCGHEPRKLAPAGSVRQRSRPASAHRFAATCVAWYPVDSGMFVSGSADKSLRLWDTNT